MTDAVRLIATVEERETDLSLELTLQNHAKAAIYAFWTPHQGVDDKGAFRLDPFSYALEIEGESVVLAKKIVAVPELTFVEKRNVPFVVRVDGETQISETLAVPLPARERGPYLYLRDEAPDAKKMVRVLDLYAEVGFFVAKPGTDGLLKTFRTTRGEARGFMPFPIGSQILVRSAMLARIPVLTAAPQP